MSIYPKQCKNLKFFECRKTKLVQKVEVKNDWQVQKELTNQAFWLVNDKKKSQMANLIFCFEMKGTPWMTQIDGAIFPWSRDMRTFLLLNHQNFFMYIINK